jgi:hypothetical protein
VEQGKPLQAVEAADMAGESQAVRARLARFRALAEPPAAIARIEERLAEIRSHIERLEPESHFEVTNLSEALINDQRAKWKQLGDELRDGRMTTGDYVENPGEANSGLEELRVIWDKTRKGAIEDGLPGAVLSRIEETYTGIVDTEKIVKQQRARILILQNAIGQSEEIAASTIIRLGESERRVQEELFQSKQAPLWKMIGFGASNSEPVNISRRGWDKTQRPYGIISRCTNGRSCCSAPAWSRCWPACSCSDDAPRDSPRCLFSIFIREIHRVDRRTAAR